MTLPTTHGRRGARTAAGALALGAALLTAPAARGATAPAYDLASRLAVLGTPDTRIGHAGPHQREGGYVAKILMPVRARVRPGLSPVWRVEPDSMYTGNATRLMVLDARYDADGRAWLDVQLPIRPNGASGWIPADATLVRHTPWFARIRLAGRSVSVYREGRLVKRVRAVVGAPGTPTPRGQFAIYEEAPRPSAKDFLGPWALHLTAFSDVLTNYGGGPGRVAVHGRGPESRREAPLGAAASHGCVRIDNGPVSWMQRHLDPGTPVRISKR